MKSLIFSLATSSAINTSFIIFITGIFLSI
jgi:hypothetical protein